MGDARNFTRSDARAAYIRVIVVDTHLISEMMKPAPLPKIGAWWRSQNDTELYVTVISQGEILYGVELLPPGKRRTDLSYASERAFLQFDDRILPFDSDAAREFARIAAARRRAGQPISQADAQIAAIARSRGASLATRNADDFAHCGIKVLNPWA
jgi:toxin FitB